jgi:hypothetical protein
VEDLNKVVSATVIFCDREEINTDNLKNEIKIFYESNYQTDEIFVIGSQNIQNELTKVFITEQNNTFIHIPKRQDTFLNDHLYILSFSKNGDLSCINGKNIPKEFLDTFLNEGLQNVFIKRGGLITSQDSHHFVFPSGKHCDKFLRTGNILLISSEIYFIAFALLKHFDEEIHTQIYCDTSSINSVAFALTELKNRFITNKRKQIPIESFSSYDGLYKNPIGYGANALLIISASTSSNIIAYILDSHKMIDRKNIVILYFLGEESKYSNIKDKVICNLTESKSNPNGIPFYSTFKEEDCEHCKKGSYAVEVSGDVFLLEKPQINRVLLTVNDAEKYLSGFVQQFKSVDKSNTVLKANYKEDSELKYEVYINYYEILDGLANGSYSKYKKKLDDYINQYVPSNTKYILTLNDHASEKLGAYISEKVNTNYQQGKEPKPLKQDNLNEIQKNTEGSVLVVGSCISNGKNLLYISRALRKHDKLRIVYFVGISRTKNKEYLNFLKSNLKQGSYGSETSSFIEVDTIYCNNNSVNTSWLREIQFLSKFIDFIGDEFENTGSDLEFLKERKALLQDSASIDKKGLAQNLFYPRFTDGKIEELNIRKSFAYFSFNDYVKHVTQSDIYFTISNVINSKRNSEKNDKSLKQSVFVRSVIDPGNFTRFNDGIIQASILRACYADELSYSFDNDLSQEMFNTLETIIKYQSDEQGEALLEFLYAIAIKKLSIKKLHLQRLLDLLDKCDKDIYKYFSKFIYKEILEEKKVELPKEAEAEESKEEVTTAGEAKAED